MAGRSGIGTVALALVIATVAAGLSGCDVRRETPDPVWPSPDAATAARDDLAEAIAAVVTAAAADGSGEARSASELAAAELDALGGVYVAYPSATASPEESASPAQPPGVDDAIADLRIAAQSTLSHGVDDDLSRLALAIDVAWARFQWSRDTRGTTHSVLAMPDARGFAPTDAAFAPDAASDLDQQTLSALALAHDQARFAYVTIAANLGGEERAAALARAQVHAERSDAIAALLDDDVRTPVYQLRDVDLSSQQGRTTLAGEVERSVSETSLRAAFDASHEDRTWLLDDSFDTWAAAQQIDPQAPTPLPGLGSGEQ